MNSELLKLQLELDRQGESFVAVTVVGKRGSVPQDVGSKAIVTRAGLYAGTVGGGKVEAWAIEHAKNLTTTNSSETKAHTEIINLNRDLGMSCGGEIRLLFEPSQAALPWHIAVFGAGHVAQSLTKILSLLDCHVHCFDSRSEWIEKLQPHPRLRTVVTENMAEELVHLRDSTQIVIVTKGHASDLPVLKQAILENRFPYIGVIGSRSKGIRLQRALIEQGISQEDATRFHCPMGLPIGQNQTAEIAISIIGQLIWYRDQVHEQWAHKWKRKPLREAAWPS